MFNKVLIANRGEIAARVARTCSRLGVKSVAIYSDADWGAPHTEAANEAHYVGAAPVAHSYLNIERIIDIAQHTGCDAIHPGYGLLSENVAFINAIQTVGLTFIGPHANNVELMGDKQRARAFARDCGIPIVPGSDEITDSQQAKEFAERMGYPILVKAAAGGGGIGMKVAKNDKALVKAIDECRRRGKSAFGDDKIYLEQYIADPRHVEIQILADNHGNALHLFERECSVQRRHQKVIEEAPSVLMSQFPTLREKMTSAALTLTRKAQYVNAGTVEFIVDTNGNYYFIEMNTRLQVEHPVTESITGLDLVELQLLIATGQPLPMKQNEVLMGGHAIECRIYAENPDKMFLPSPGTIGTYLEPENVRVDSGVKGNWDVVSFYDPMIAKVIAHADTRELATRKMISALSEYKIGGLKNNLMMHIKVLDSDVFQQGSFNTLWLEKFMQ